MEALLWDPQACLWVSWAGTGEVDAHIDGRPQEAVHARQTDELQGDHWRPCCGTRRHATVKMAHIARCAGRAAG
eukprot:1158908-Pelagomonas_calceolata.AAC.5